MKRPLYIVQCKLKLSENFATKYPATQLASGTCKSFELNNNSRMMPRNFGCLAKSRHNLAKVSASAKHNGDENSQKCFLIAEFVVKHFMGIRTASLLATNLS